MCHTAGIKAYAQSTFLQHYTTKDGLPSNNCYFTLQDSKGYLWFGTDAGVSRFDGKRFENFTIDDGLPDNQILMLQEDKKGRVWFMAFNGEMSYFLDGIIYNSKNDKALRLLKFNAIVISMFHDSKDRLWFGTNKNMLFMFDGVSLTKFTAEDTKNQFFLTYVYEDIKGKIWAYSNQCVRFYQNGNFKLSGLAPPKSFSYKTISCLGANRFLYVNKYGLHARRGNQNSTFIKIDTTLLNQNLGYFYGNTNELWLSHNNGIYHRDKLGKVTNYLQGIPTVQVIKDNKNNMWFTTTTGIYMLPRKENRLFIINQNQGLSNNVIKSITKDKNKNLWLGLGNGDLNKVAHQTLKVNQIEIPDKKSFNTGLKKLILDEANQSLYFASNHGLGVLLNIYNKKSPIKYLKETNNSLFVIKDFSINKNMGLSLALSSGIVLLQDRKKKFEYNVLELINGINFFNDRSYSIFYDNNDDLWFSNIDGLNQFSKNKVIPFFRESLLTKRVNDINQLADGTIILATDGYGLLFIKGGKMVLHFTLKDGLSSNICKKIFVSNNHIWVVTSQGINEIRLENGTTDIKAFEYTDALLKNDVNDVFVDQDTSYFATNTGLVYFLHKPLQATKEIPKAIFSSIEVNSLKRSLKDTSIVLSPAKNKIAFYFGAIDFQGQEFLFRYRLKPDDDWTETKNRKVEVNALKPGNYTFELSARTNNDSWGPSAKINFVQKAYFWQSTWFMLLLFVAAGISFYRIAVIVTKKQKNKEQQKLLLKNKILMLEQNALQAMMNPHFVFNVMNSIQHYINTNDTGSANKVLTGFARLIRKNMEICTKSYISLEEELAYLELYLSLEKKRFGNKLRYKIEIDPKIDQEETKIPSMLLQPYIENAIWHGIMPIDTGGDLEVSINLISEHSLHIEIKDNGIGIDNSLKYKKHNHSSKGMSLTQERINLLNQIDAYPIQIKVQQIGTSGTSVLISIALP